MYTVNDDYYDTGVQGAEKNRRNYEDKLKFMQPVEHGVTNRRKMANNKKAIQSRLLIKVSKVGFWVYFTKLLNLCNVLITALQTDMNKKS